MNAIPTPQAFFLEVAPHKKFDIVGQEYVSVLKIQFYTGILDAYCVECGENSVFQSDCTF